MHEHMRERFWSKVTKTPTCWLWNAGKLGKYGGIGVNCVHTLAHRISWEMAHGQSIPSGLWVLHSCDNTLCVNPSHLRIGTHSDNLRDSWQRTRNLDYKGPRNPNARLTADEVAAIRAEPYRYGIGRALALTYGVTPTQISRIRHGQSHP